LIEKSFSVFILSVIDVDSVVMGFPIEGWTLCGDKEMGDVLVSVVLGFVISG
jgi:hypothetical protein